MAVSSVILGVGGVSQAESDIRYVRRNADNLVESNVTMYFMDSGSNARIKHGKIYIRNDSTNSWHYLGVRNTADGVPNFYLGPEES